MKYHITLQGQMAYARIFLENLNKTALPTTAKDGITYELAKPTLPSKCPKCGYKSYCDAAWIRSTDPEMPPTIFRACPCGQSVIEARPEGEKPYTVLDLTDDVAGYKS
jgi:DNA-directed RNA polymerase subunit M/transcription elongation factor TFIIS